MLAINSALDISFARATATCTSTRGACSHTGVESSQRFCIASASEVNMLRYRERLPPL